MHTAYFPNNFLTYTFCTLEKQIFDLKYLKLDTEIANVQLAYSLLVLWEPYMKMAENEFDFVF